MLDIFANTKGLDTLTKEFVGFVPRVSVLAFFVQLFRVGKKCPTQVASCKFLHELATCKTGIVYREGRTNLSHHRKKKMSEVDHIVITPLSSTLYDIIPSTSL